MTEEGLFSGAHAALTFAFRYSRQQLPCTPIAKCGGGSFGSDKGLVGMDAAAQAGMILAAVDKLPVEQRNVIVARFGDVRRDCPCCGQPAPTTEWQDAVDALSHCAELDGVPRRVRRAAVERAICRRRVSMADLAERNGLVVRTLQHQVGALRKRLEKLGRIAINNLDEKFQKTGIGLTR